jgi:regulatory helix-turn-helix LysR family protein
VSLATLDLNLLLILDTVLTERSVVRAARRLHVTPSAVSNALARLRVALDDPLLIRSGRGVVPTSRARCAIWTRRFTATASTRKRRIASSRLPSPTLARS